jgi:hypothetical protein
MKYADRKLWILLRLQATAQGRKAEGRSGCGRVIRICSSVSPAGYENNKAAKLPVFAPP